MSLRFGSGWLVIYFLICSCTFKCSAPQLRAPDYTTFNPFEPLPFSVTPGTRGFRSLDREGAPQAVVAWGLFRIPKGLKCVERREAGREAGVHAPQRQPRRLPMESMYYIGLDVHKKTISYCVKDAGGRIHAEGKIPATRFDLDRWMKTLPQPWTVAMEATMFTGWIYDHLLPHAAAVKVAHPLMLRAIAAAKKRAIASMPTRLLTACVVIFYRNATWLRPRFANGGALCVIAICSSTRPCS